MVTKANPLGNSFQNNSNYSNPGQEPVAQNQGSKFLKKAAQQILGECLGFDEARAYYLLLTNRDNKIEKEFSYSKKYRLLKNLFSAGAVGKIKPHDKDFFSYMPLPPVFLDSKEHPEIVNYLEGIYVKNHKKLIGNAVFSQVMLKNINRFVLFLLNHFMKENALISGSSITGSYLEKHLRNTEKISNITIKPSNFKTRHVGIIDSKIGFEFSKIKNKQAYDYIGFIACRVKKSNDKQTYNSHVESIEREFNSKS